MISRRYPTRFDLDEVCPDRPVLLQRVCLHIAVANSLALKMAEISEETPDPEGGKIVRFAADDKHANVPNGLLEEFAAVMLVKNRVQLTSEEKQAAISAGLNQCLHNGVTAVQTIEEWWNEYALFAREDRLPIRVFYSALGDDRPKAEERCGDLLSCDRVKIFADGCLGGHTAALSLPYKEKPNETGLLLQSQVSRHKFD